MESTVLTLAETARYLKVSEKTIHRMIEDNGIPCAKIGGQWRFMKTMLDGWLQSQMRVIPQQDYIDALHAQKDALSLGRLISPSCVFLDLPAITPEHLLRTLSGALKESGALSDEDSYLQQLLEREKLMSTGIGHGIALPHPRQAGLPPVKYSALAIGYCPEGIDFSALDGEKTHLFFAIASSSDPLHLRVLSLLTRIAGEADLLPAVKGMSGPEELIRFIMEKEIGILY